MDFTRFSVPSGWVGGRRLEVLRRVSDDRDVMRIGVQATTDRVGQRPGFEVESPQPCRL